MIKSLIFAVAAVSFAAPALAANLVVNGSFEDTTATVKSYFQYAGVTGWTGGINLTFIDFPGTADDGSYLSVYPGFPATSPDGGKFVEADGDPNYAGAIYQTVGGLTAGKSYAVKFYQAAGQQNNFGGPTTERFQVSLGSDSQLSSLISLAQGATGPWQAQTLNFTATATSEVLSFLAVGTPGGAPPISFLDGVSLTASGTPEPAAWALMLAGFGLVGFALRRRATAVTVAA